METNTAPGRHEAPRRWGATMSGPVVLPAVETDTELSSDSTSEDSRPFHLILLDDNEHTAEYVIQMLGDILGFSFKKALDHTIEVDTVGHTRLATLPKAEAERKRDAIHAYGADWRIPTCLGSMAALVDPAT